MLKVKRLTTILGRMMMIMIITEKFIDYLYETLF